MGLKAYAGAGTVFMAPVNSSGVKTGPFRKVGTAYPLTVQVKTDQVKKKSREVETAGQIIAARTKIADDGMTGAFTLHEWNAANLAWAVSGTATSTTTVGATVTDEAVTVLTPGEWVQLGGATPRRNVSAVAVNNAATPATIYSPTTDYEVDAVTGLITSRAGGLLAAGTVACVVDYTYAAKSDYRVTIGDQVQVRVAILAHLYDEFRDEHYTMEIDSALLSSNSEINFISEEDSTGEELVFAMVLETLSGQTSPARIDGVPM